MFLLYYILILLVIFQSPLSDLQIVELEETCQEHR